MIEMAGTKNNYNKLIMHVDIKQWEGSRGGGAWPLWRRVRIRRGTASEVLFSKTSICSYTIGGENNDFQINGYDFVV